MIVDSIREVDLKLPKTRDGLLEEGIKLSKLALVTFSELENRTQTQNVYQTLSIAYKLKGDWKNALIATDSFIAIRDSVLSKDNKLVMANLATTREEELKEKQIALNKLEIEKKYNERWLFGGGLALLVLLAIGLVINLRFVHKSRHELQHEKDISEGLLLNIHKLVSEQEQTIQVRTAELAASNDKLIHANKKLVELIQYNAHNLREPLMRISGAMVIQEYLPTEEFFEDIWPQMRKAVTDLDDSIKNVINIADETVEFKR
jgi:signal transduction histidine kinase